MCSSVNDELSFVALACASFGAWWEQAIGVGGALCVTIVNDFEQLARRLLRLTEKKQATNKQKH